METILIRPELLEKAKGGTKTTTCRNGIRTYPLGKTVLKSNESDDFIYINIKELKYYKLKNLTDDISRSDGFVDKANLITVMRDIYEDITDESDITIVCFDVVKGAGTDETR